MKKIKKRRKSKATSSQQTTPAYEENPLWKTPIILLRDLRLIGGTVKHGRIVVHVIDMDDNGGVIFIFVIRCDEPELVLIGK